MFQFMQVVVPALVALAVVALGHVFAANRDREARRREQRIGYLVNAFHPLTKANHHPRLYEVADELERAIADLQVFGTEEQVRLARKFAHELGTVQTAGMDDLLVDLRNSLRREMGRKPIAGNVTWLRVGRTFDTDEEAQTSRTSV